MATVEEKVDRLEKALDEFVKNVGIEFNKAYNLMVQLQIEMKEGWEKFKQEIEQANERWRREMEQSLRERDERWKQQLNELSESLRQSLRERDEQWNQQLNALSERLDQSLRERDERWEKQREEYQKKLEEERRQWNFRWGELANRLGTMVEDLVYPSLPRIIKEEFNLEVEFIAVDVKKKINGREKEYDAIAIAGNYVFINSTKSRLRVKDVDDFVNDILEFREFYPEYATKKLIGVLATLRIDENVLKYAEKVGFLVLAVGDEFTEVKNTKGFKPKEW